MKYVAHIWDVGHKMVALFRGTSITPLHTILWVTGDGVQTHHAQVPSVLRVAVSVRNTIQSYLNLVDWRHIQEGVPQGDVKDWSTSLEFTQWKEQQTAKDIPSQEVGELIRGLIYEPSTPILMERLEEVKDYQRLVPLPYKES
jgi:hypothetical protein